MSTFVPDVFVTQAAYRTWVALGRPISGPDALPAGARPVNPPDLTRLGQAVALLSTLVDAGVGPGPDPGSGTVALVHQQATPSARWNIVTALGRPPVVALWIGGQLQYTDVECLPPYTTTSLIFPTPVAGTAVLT